MSHYFSKDNNTIKSNPSEIAFRVCETEFICTTDHGVFSRHGLDRGTTVLLDYLVVDDDVKTALDLGCGYGPIGLVLNKVYGLEVEMIDINPRAIELAKQNVQRNKAQANIYGSDGFEQVKNSFDLIVTNPPIRVGKQAMYQLLESAKDYLNPDGTMIFVIHKKHGANSAINFVRNVYESVELLGRNKGFHVIRCRKALTS